MTRTVTEAVCWPAANVTRSDVNPSRSLGSPDSRTTSTASPPRAGLERDTSTVTASPSSTEADARAKAAVAFDAATVTSSVC